MGHWGQRLDSALRAQGQPKLASVATEIGVDESAISRWKQGRSISLENAIRLCTALDLSMDWLFLGRGQMTSQGLNGGEHASDGYTDGMQRLPKPLEQALDDWERLIFQLTIQTRKKLAKSLEPN